MLKKHILGDFNINIVHEENTVCTKFASVETKKYHQFCTMYGLKQLIQLSARVTCCTPTLTDHILTRFPSTIFKKRVTNGGLSYHQLIFCTQNISKFKTGGVQKYINFRSLKNYRVDDYKKSLG